MRLMLLCGWLALVGLTLAPAAQTQDKGPPKKPGDPEMFINFLLKQFDTNGDGKIARSEARGKLADTFAKVDQNSDGFLDRAELRVLAGVAALAKKGPPPADANDFDALDKDADGRLTQGELKNTPWLARFADVDANRDGRIDRREFEAHQRKAEEKK